MILQIMQLVEKSWATTFLHNVILIYFKMQFISAGGKAKFSSANSSGFFSQT